MNRRALGAFATTLAVVATLLPLSAASAATTVAADLPGLLRVAAVDTEHSYDRGRFEHWVDADSDGCNTRYEVLIEESTTPVSVGSGCSLAGGTWVSPYDGFMTQETARIQIDHVVALAEAWRSGAWAWTDEQRREFANDLGVAYALTAASDVSNQAKADKDPARWLPTNGSYTCEYVTSWALIKYRWSLSVDTEELETLQDVLAGTCGSSVIDLPPVVMPLSAPGQPTAGGEVTGFPAGGTRLAGASRYETAIQVARRYAAGVPAVFVTTGLNFPDALSAAAAAAYLGGPMLLTPPESLAPAVRDEIIRLRPMKIYVAGDTGAVSQGVGEALEKIAPVERLGGVSRYETGNTVVEKVFPSATRAFIATGRTFPDALAATGAAGASSSPVILVDGMKPTVPSESITLLSRLGVRQVTIVGGPGAVSSTIEAQLSRTFSTTRIGGTSRYDTAARINDAHFAPSTAPAAFIATGLNFPDALAGAALAGRLKSPVYITSAACVPEPAHVSLTRQGVPSIVTLGSANVVSANAAANIGCLTAATPTIGGTARVGSTLTAYTGTWTAGAAFRYQWLANGVPLSGATAGTLALASKHVGQKIAVRVTGSKPGYLATTVTSRPTSAVTAVTQTPPPPPASTKPVDSWNCPAWAPIKGNADSMIYHVPGGAYYSRTKPEECFTTETAARSAGYRKSQR